jgi:hypothetical protein
MSSSSAFGMQVDIHYRVFLEDAARDLLPVTTPRELMLEAAIRAADPWRRIEWTPDAASQSAILHRHAVETLYAFSFETYRIDLATGDNSVWDPRTRKWRDIWLGASRVYRIDGATNLFLAVWTAGTEANGPVVASV